MIRGASHLHKFYIQIDMSSIASIEATYSQSGKVILRKTELEMDYNSVEECITIPLTQYETLKFNPVGVPAAVGPSLITIQFKFLTVDGDVYVTKPVQDRLYDVLNNEAIQ